MSCFLWPPSVDDGAGEKAWDFKVGSEPYRKLTPGTFVHARVNLRHRDGGLILINIDDRLIRSSIWNHANDPLS